MLEFVLCLIVGVLVALLLVVVALIGWLSSAPPFQIYAPGESGEDTTRRRREGRPL